MLRLLKLLFGKTVVYSASKFLGIVEITTDYSVYSKGWGFIDLKKFFITFPTKKDPIAYFNSGRRVVVFKNPQAKYLKGNKLSIEVPGIIEPRIAQLEGVLEKPSDGIDLCWLASEYQSGYSRRVSLHIPQPNNKVYMGPSWDLTDSEVDNIIDWVKKFIPKTHGVDKEILQDFVETRSKK